MGPRSLANIFILLAAVASFWAGSPLFAQYAQWFVLAIGTLNLVADWLQRNYPNSPTIQKLVK